METQTPVKDVVAEAEDQIRLFEQWFTGELKEAPLTSYEKAILKTFVINKSLGKF